MFPSEFAFEAVAEFCPPGGAVLDPFAGRASSIYAAAALGRSGYGIEINPVGWLYGRVKLKPAKKPGVVARNQHIGHLAMAIDQEQLNALPTFFSSCYAPRVLRYLLAARDALRWRTSVVDATLMAIILVHLHGKRSQSLSNQMRQGKAMSPDYSVRWWHDRKMTPPDMDPVEFLRARMDWRYEKGVPTLADATVKLGDSFVHLPRMASRVSCGEVKRFNLLFTSPPYYSVTNYHYDQWLRLWMLGGESRPVRPSGPWRRKFESQAAYRTLMERVFSESAKLLEDSATVYVRTDARPFTYETTLAALRDSFPDKRLTIVPRPFSKQTQTALFGDKAQKPGEIDIILRP